jgi:membrane protein required for colicin V production
VNWLDYVLIAILVIGGLAGFKFGLIRAAFAAAGVLIGWLLAGQYSDDLGALFEDSLSNETIVTVISYAVIMLGALVAASIASKVLKPILSIFTLGLSSMVDKLGGFVLGLLIGVALAGGLIIGMARLTYDFDTSIIINAVPAQVADKVARIEAQLENVEEVKEQLETALTGSKIVSIFIDVTDAVPADALGFVPDDFRIALDFLEVSIK